MKTALLTLLLTVNCFAKDTSSASVELVFVARPMVQVYADGQVKANHKVTVVRRVLDKKTIQVTVITHE